MSAPLSLVRRPFAWWTRFWFDEVDARVLGLMRITIGVIALWTHITLFPELTHVLGQNAELFSSSAHGHWTTWSLYDAIGDPDELHRIHTLLILPYVLFILGIGGRASTIAMFVVLASLHHGNTWMLNAGDRLTRLSVFMMLFVPHTRGWSVDAWVMRKLGRPLRAVVPMTTHRLVQIQLAWMYMATGIAKWDGAHWHRGTALYYTLNVEVFQRFPDLVSPEFFASWPVYALTVAGTVVTLYWELLFPLLMLWRPTRIAALVLGVCIHSGIALMMMVASFSFATLWGYLAYVDPRRLSRLCDRVEELLGLRERGAPSTWARVRELDGDAAPPSDATSAAPA